MASGLYHRLAKQMGREYHKATAKTLYQNLLDVSATVQVEPSEVVVRLDKRAHNPYLVASGLADQATPMPWFGNKRLIISVPFKVWQIVTNSPAPRRRF